jgi:hypothetical protein
MLARVFPRITRATPRDQLAFFDTPDLFADQLDITMVHVSVAFTWDGAKARYLADAWDRIAPVSIGGPAVAKLGDGQASDQFVAGRYLAPGYTITSRGCPRDCWFCDVPKRVGRLIELPIVPGYKVQDDNLLACSEPHFRAVIAMLKQQHQRVEFTGGLEAILLQDWHVGLLASLKPKPTCFFTYDPGDDYESLAVAARKMLDAGFTRASHRLRCYVLIGYPKDTLVAATERLTDMLNLGFTPMAMLWRHPKTGKPFHGEWGRFQRSWARPAAIHARHRNTPARQPAEIETSS